MMNYIWAGMLITGIAFATYRGVLSAFSESLMESCTDGVYFVIGLAGIMAVWSGLMNIAKDSGLIDAFARLVRPVIRFLFPKERNRETIAMILMSFSANIFGAGNSATIFALKSMVMLDEENGRSPVASDAMCMFLAVNMSMIQIVPVTIVKIRSDAGSEDPGSIIIPSILAGFASMIVSIAVCKFYERKQA
ncbi:MAG TPA: nucleoside recognition domain-containing protein [Bacillota bacterium]|jgi:spore maturation protein A|nr:nucleoside recognition domain-containing protein [Bacillota bacterium]